MWSLYLAIGAGSIPVLFLINDDDEVVQELWSGGQPLGYVRLVPQK